MQLACSQRLSAGLQRRAVAAPRCRRAGRLCVSSKLVLTPTGNGSTEHIGEEVPLPGAIELKEGLFELGRAAPADIVIGIPTVSTRHAMLRVADTAAPAPGSVQISDLGSTNGTFVDGEELEPMKATALAVGSTVVFGDKYLAAFRLDFVPDPEPGPAPAAAEPEAAAAPAEAPAAPAAPAAEL
ncbi:hypothetical protein ABPG75_008266 [Micractinium tetrahymenae]